MKTTLSDDDLRSHMQIIDHYYLKNDYEQTVSLISELIATSTLPDQYLTNLLNCRTTAFVKMRLWDSAIADLEYSISLNPNDSSYYLSLGAILTWKIFYSMDFRIDNPNETLRKSMDCYRECLNRDPTLPTAWLNIIETYLFFRDWDDAISNLGLCKTYMRTNEDKMIWSWLNCLTLALDGDQIEEAEMGLLLDRSIWYQSDHDSQQVDIVLSELERLNFYPERLSLAKEVHRLYKEQIGDQFNGPI